MSHGQERFKKVLSCIVSKQGFVSAYGIALFMICLVFVTMCVTQLRLQLQLLRSQEQHLLEVYIIHQIVTHPPAQKDTQAEEHTVISYVHETKIEFIWSLPNVTADYEINHRTYRISCILDDTNHIIDLAYS